MHAHTTPSQTSLSRSASWSKLFWAQLFIRKGELWLGTFSNSSHDIHDEWLASAEHFCLQLCWFIWIAERWLLSRVHGIIDKPSLFRPDNRTGHDRLLNSHFIGMANRISVRGSTGTCPADRQIQNSVQACTTTVFKMSEIQRGHLRFLYIIFLITLNFSK